MAAITAATVKALREETGLGMMECKKALTAADGDIQAAKDSLRAKGMAMADKKASRDTKEGLVAIKKDDTGAVMVAVQCETDFCSRNDIFQAMVKEVCDMAMKADAGKIEATDEITACVQATLAKIGENMSLAGGMKICAENVGSYLHHNNKVGVLVGVDGEISDETLSDLCMHIAFANPMGLAAEDIPADIVAKEKEIAKQQAIESGKPEEIAEKMVVGKIRKFVEANALLEQAFIRDDKKKVKELLGSAKIKAFARFAIGE